MTSPSLTLVGISGQRHTRSTAYALEQSYLELQGRLPRLACLLVCPYPPENLPDYIRHHPCPPLDGEAYEQFLLYRLADLTDSDFCLLVQEDGWVINGANWRNEFFRYDFIGAPQAAYPTGPEDPQWDDWRQYADDAPLDFDEYRSGGFSLYSRRLLLAAQQWRSAGAAEDGGSLLLDEASPYGSPLSADTAKRLLFDQYGMRFAPRRVAARFALPHGGRLNGTPVFSDAVFGCRLDGHYILDGIRQVRINTPIYSLQDDLYDSPAVNHLLAGGHHFFLPSEFDHTQAPDERLAAIPDSQSPASHN